MKASKCLIINTNIDEEKLKENLKYAAKMITEGKTVVFPTETVYGIGANALDSNAAKKIYEAKGRPSDNPLIVHIADRSDIYTLAVDISKDALKLMDKFWPGPLTIILKKSQNVPLETTGGLDTIAIRMPSNKIARELIINAKLPIAAPSANISGRPSITLSKYLIEELSDRVDAIIISDDSEIGLESTVLDMTTDFPKILRPGKIGKKEIELVLHKEVLIDKSFMDEKAIPLSPGMKYKHYSPNAKVIVVTGDSSEIYTKIKFELDKSGSNLNNIKVVCLEDRVHLYGKYALSLGKNSNEAAKNLFAILRLVDELNVDIVYFEYMHGDNVVEAIMNRLNKAAGSNIL